MTDSSVFIRSNIVWDQWQSTLKSLKARSVRASLNQGTAIYVNNVNFIHQGKYTVAHICKRNKQFLKHNTLFLKHKSTSVKHTIIETQHKIIEKRHKIIEIQHKITETQHKIIETQQKKYRNTQNYRNTTQNYRNTTQIKISETQHKIIELRENWCAAIQRINPYLLNRWYVTRLSNSRHFSWPFCFREMFCASCGAVLSRQYHVSSAQ